MYWTLAALLVAAAIVRPCLCPPKHVKGTKRRPMRKFTEG